MEQIPAAGGEPVLPALPRVAAGDRQLNLGLMSAFPVLRFLLCSLGFKIAAFSAFPSSKAASSGRYNSQSPKTPLPLFFSLFFFSFHFEPPPFPFESVNERMSKAREVWKDFIPGEVRVGWKAEGAAKGQFENRKPCGSEHAGPS